jgi:hypothetical protein
MRIALSFLRIVAGRVAGRPLFDARRLVAAPMMRFAAAAGGAFVLGVACCSSLPAQPPNNAAKALIAPGGQQNAPLVPAPNAGGTAQQGGAANADFDSLIELITSTIQTEMWVDNGGTGDIRPFPTGVLVDAAGTLQLRTPTTPAHELALIRERGRAARPKDRSAPAQEFTGRSDGSLAAAAARRVSNLRCISLPRLEREIARRQAARQPLEPAMLTLAGLQRVRYLFVYPDSRDLVLAGPAGDWQVDAGGRIVSVDTGQPVVRLDDLLVLLRRGEQAADSFFGCSINPRSEALASAQAFLASTGQRPLQPGQRKTWLAELRNTMGRQNIEVFGIEPASRVASVLIEADYHMKLIGMGLADSVDGVNSYLDLVKASAERDGMSPPAMSVLRWWFALDYDSIAASPGGDAFQLVGQGARVLSENELLARRGRRVHTGRSDALNRQFAESFTRHFDSLAAKYPLYGDLRNIFDLAMAVALIQSEDLIDRANWQPALLLDAGCLRLPQWAVPRQVESVVNHRLVNRRHVVAGVSGGVMVAPRGVLEHARVSHRLPDSAREAGLPNVSPATWWWDAVE